MLEYLKLFYVLSLTPGTTTNLLCGIMFLGVFERMMAYSQKWTWEQFQYKTITPIPRGVKSTIECERIMNSSTSKQTTTSHARMDAVIHYVTTIPAIRNLLCMTHHDYLPNEFESIQVDVDIYFQLTKLKHNDGQVDQIVFRLFSYEHEIQHIQTFIEKCNADYERRMANKLGTSLFFFDMMTSQKSKKSVQNTLPTSHIVYTKHDFHTTRTFNNVFFEQKQKVSKHVDFFLNRKDWYDKKGIPYTLGFMFHGDPGCGKTSTVKAVANTARRHIINVHLSEIKTKAQLRHLFFNNEIHVYNGTTTERYTIPIHERMYVIEDIDAMGDTLMSREHVRPTAKPSSGDPWLDKQEEVDEPLDLSFLLNLLDGTLESSGRILAISSNFPERIDKALIRPGRIDMIINFKKCNTQILKEMIESFYEKTIDSLDESLNGKYSPAEVNQILFRNFDDMENAISELSG